MDRSLPAYRHDVIPLVPPGERLLDIGGGCGATALELKRLGRCKVAGVADKVASPERGALDFTCRIDLTEPQALPRVVAEYGPFDTVLCLDVLEHLPQPERLMPEIFASLRPGGTLVASIPNVRHWSVVMPLLLRGRWDYADAGILDRTHLRFFVRDSAVALIGDAGFTIEAVKRSGFGHRKYRVMNALSLGLLRDLFVIQYYIVAKRPALA